MSSSATARGDESGRTNLKDLMKNAFKEHEAHISELKEREGTLQANLVIFEKKKEKLKEKESNL